MAIRHLHCPLVHGQRTIVPHATSKSIYDLPSGAPSPVVKEEHIEYGFIGKLQNLKYEFRDDIRDRAALE